ncbi:MAG: YbaK/EbsC family protein [Bacteroidota bacterium]|nr:YbaK/EbsC family protein [Bacteroidota bacterium]
MDIFSNICTSLRDRNVAFRTVHHQPTFTSEESAKARGEEVKIGGKALLIKVDDSFRIFVLSAALKIDSKKIKEYFKAKSAAAQHPVQRGIRFASKEELLELTGLVPGSVPPFGRPILNFDLFVDSSIVENEKIAFNAGSLTDSIIMKTTDYLAFANPIIFSFSQIV